MPYDPERHHRRSIRLKDCDYTAPGAYFVTICAQGRLCLFGDVIEGDMCRNDAGRMVNGTWSTLHERMPRIVVEAAVTMPNHVHAMLVLTDPVPDTDSQATQQILLGQAVGMWKSLTTHCYLRGVLESDWLPFDQRLWQRNYWEHVIRNDSEYARLRAHIANNPGRWHEDRLHPAAPDWRL